MKKIGFLILLGLIVTSVPVSATVSVNAGPTSLIPDPIVAKAASNQIGLFSITLNQDAGETLSSMSVAIGNAASSTASSTDFTGVSIYKDNGDGSFNYLTDLLAGSTSTVNVGSATVIPTSANNALNGSKFFLSMATSATWGSGTPNDSIRATMPTGAIITSANSPTVTEAVTNTITADIAAPTLASVVAKNTGGTAAKESGDTVELTFSETTNKPAVNAGNIASLLALNNSHTWLDSTGVLGAATWSVDGKVLTIALATSTPSSTLSTVAVGDSVTVSGSVITDLAGNPGSGSRTITGNFGTVSDDDDDEDDEDKPKSKCGNALINGRLYKVKGEATVYLAAACRLKAFRGQAVFKARGKKFQNIIELESLQGITISKKPVLPAGGTLIKGSDATVWFVTHEGKRRGFKNAAKFFALGFAFGQVKQISDQDLNLVVAAPPIEDNEEHPNGALMKCGASPLVFQIVDGKKFPFRTAESFTERGHAWESIAVVDCGRYVYITGAPVE